MREQVILDEAAIKQWNQKLTFLDIIHISS
jgi:hypothetical protein